MKRVIIILLILVVLGIPAYLILSSQQSQDDFYTQLNHFNDLLRNKEYEQAKQVYNEASSGLKANYNISLESYAHDLAEEAKRLDTTQESLDLLYTYHDIGYQSVEIDNAILYYEDLLQSNYIYIQGLEYYNNQNFENAMDCFRDVLEYDENYQNAQDYLTSYQEYMLAWSEAKENSQYGRSPYPSAIAYKDSYMYIPYQFTNSNAILKIHATSYTVFSFPIVYTKYGAKISNLNIVGNYIFFLLENSNPLAGSDGNGNAVYRISLSGSGLTKIADCDYTYLITYEDNFYALSQSKGIVKIDNYFVNEEILVDSKNTIIEMQLVDGGISYTAQDAESDNNIQYFYDGETTEEVKKEVDMHYYDYGDDNIIHYGISGFSEYLYNENTANKAANNTQLYVGDIYKYYGMLNGSVIYTYIGEYQQECIRVTDISNSRTTYRAEKNKISYKPIGICYDIGTIMLQSDSGISFTKEDMRIQQTIPLPHINSAVLTENEESVTSIEEGFFTADKQITKDENTWLYSDEMVNIKTEKVYLDYIESTVYISNIYTNDYRWLQSASIDKLTKPIDAASGMVWAVAGQAYNDELNLINDDRGIINEDVYVYNDDGMFIPYRKDNVIPAEKITNSKVVYAFSQGDIILENYAEASDALKTTVFDGRSAIGMVEPGHYIFITAQKASKTNRGLSLYTLANLFKDYGCISAFCFDSDYYASIFDGEYIYEDDKNSEYIRKYNEVLYYSGE